MTASAAMGRSRVRGGLPIRLRSALAAATVAAIAFTAGGWWLRHEIYVSKQGDALNRAKATLNLVGTLYLPHSNGTPVYFPFQTDDSWVIVDQQGRMVEGAPELAPFVPGALGPVRPGTPIYHEVDHQVRFGTAPDNAGSDSKRLAGGDYTVLTSAFYGPGLLVETSTSGVSTTFESTTQLLTVDLVVTSVEADQAVAAVDRVLFPAIPVAVLLVALIVWFTTARALRPVEEIQRRLRAITAHNLSLRVPVPRRRDEIARLAATTNDTLDRLERAVERQRRFTADASHELRTPLAALRADLEVALHYPRQTDWSAVIRGTLDDAERLQQLTEDLLLLAELENADGTAHRVSNPVNLAELVHGAVAEASRHAPDGMTVKTEMDAETSVTVEGDARRLERLLRNLLDNAVRHARDQVTVTLVRATPPAAVVVIEVCDDGPGIPAADRERVFERFTRLDTSRDRSTGGTGLGLAIAREIAHHHGGKLTLADTPPGAGARFAIELPVTDPQDH